MVTGHGQGLMTWWATARARAGKEEGREAACSRRQVRLEKSDDACASGWSNKRQTTISPYHNNGTTDAGLMPSLPTQRKTSYGPAPTHANAFGDICWPAESIL